MTTCGLGGTLAAPPWIHLQLFHLQPLSFNHHSLPNHHHPIHGCQYEVCIPLQSPILGYLWGTSIPWLRVPRGYPFQHGICDLYHSMVWWNGHLIPFQSFFAIPQPLTPYQWYCLCTNTRHTTIPYQLCSRMAVTGWLGSFLQKYQKISVGCYASLLGLIFNRLVLGNFLSILRHQ